MSWIITPEGMKLGSMHVHSMRIALLIASLLTSCLLCPALPLGNCALEEAAQSAVRQLAIPNPETPPSAAPHLAVPQGATPRSATTQPADPPPPVAEPATSQSSDLQPPLAQPATSQSSDPEQADPQAEDPQSTVPESAATQPATPQEDSAAGGEAVAPQPQPLVPGDTVKLKTARDPGQLKGTLMSLNECQITVVVKGGAEVSVPWASIKRLDVQVGVRHRYGTWALIGGGVGVFLGLLVPNHEECFAPGCPDEEAFARSQAVVIGGVLGVLTGLVAEGTSPPSAPKWGRVLPLTYPPYRPAAGKSVGFGVAPDRDGLAVRLVLGF